MTMRDRDIDDWFRRFMGSRRWSPWGTSTGGGMFREFEDMRRDMERMFEETIQDIERVPKELVREYETPSGKVREVGPLVYGYTATIGPDGKPKIREFGNIRPSSLGAAATPMLSSEIEPLADVITSDKEVKVTVDMPGVSKQDIKINAYDGTVQVSTVENAKRRYNKVVELPPETDIETAKSTFTNGILEITFSKKAKPKGKEIKVE
jgi:HSP20 family protein